MRPKILLSLLVAPLSAFALPIPINQIVVFGDSLSDNGNAAYELGGLAPLNYANNAFTDGPATNPSTAGPFGLWIDQFAANAGLSDPAPFLAVPGGTNYAVASALTGTANPQDIGNQVTDFLLANSGSAPSDDLYAIWGGANDILDGDNPITAATNLYDDILALAGDGAKYFLWLNLPPLGDTPLVEAEGSTAITEANAASALFDQTWATDLGLLSGDGIEVVGVNVAALFGQILGDPGAYGFTTVNSPAQGQSGNPNTYLFWDDEHPTTAGDALVADLALADLDAVPEPSALLLLLSGAGALWMLRRAKGGLL